MKTLLRIRPWLAALALAASISPGAQAARPPARQAALTPVTGEVIVKFRSGSTTARKQALAVHADAATVQTVLAARASALGSRVGRALAAGPAVGERIQVVRAEGVDAAALARELAADAEVEFAVPNGRKRRLAAPDDPLYGTSATLLRPNGVGSQPGPESGQWYLRAPDDTLRSAIGIEAAWAHTRGSSDVVVAVLDTGVRFEHPDLGRAATGGRLLPGYDFVSNTVIANDGNGRDADPSDPGDWVSFTEASGSTFSGCGASASSWHGTATASLVGAATDNAIGMAGAAPGVRVLPVRVLGKCYGTDADIQAAMRWAGGLHVAGVPDNPHPARVLNLSLGGEGACDEFYQGVVDELRAAGVTVVAAAGNTAGGPVGTPANCTGVIAVLALRHAGTKVGFSDLGPEIALAAPGGNCVNIAEGSPCLYPILAASDSGSQGPVASAWSNSFDATVGTSFASPLVAGVAGLMLSQQPQLTPAELRSTLQATARAFPTSGADNGPDDPTPVTACHAPTFGVEQLQCYCTTGLCGAGMVDAGAALAALAGSPLARIELTTATPTAGSPVDFSAHASTTPDGAHITRYAWLLLDGGGIATGFSSAVDAESATLTPSAAGRFTVQLTVTDDRDRSHTTTLTVVVAAVPVTTPLADAGGGGGAAGPLWTLALLAAVMALRRRG